MEQLMEKAKKIIPGWLGIRATQLYIFAMLVIFPFFFTEKMFNLHLDKRDFFLFFSIAYICTILPSFLIALYDWGNNMYAPNKPDIIFALILLSAFIISTIFALNTKKSFFEMSSRTVSGLCFLFCMLTFFAVRQYGKADKFLMWSWIAGSSALYLFGILCACGINVMYIQDGLDSTQLPIYLTPLSNTNYNTCYVCLMLPPIMVLYMLCKEQLSQILCGICLYLGFMFTLFIKTESSILAILLGTVLLGFFALESDSWFIHYIHIVGIYLGAKLTVHILLNLFPSKLYPFHGLTLRFLRNRLLIFELLCYTLFFLLYTWKQENVREKILSARKYLVITGVLLASFGIICIIYANLNAANLPKGSFWHNLVVADSTFSGRGYIWRRTISVLKDETIGRKLFGNGMNSFRTLMRLTRTLPAGNTFADPHNEFLQMATDMGVVGLIGYFGLLLSSLIKGLRTWQKHPYQIIIVLTLSVYMTQSLANEYSIFTLPLLFIFLGLANKQYSTS